MVNFEPGSGTVWHTHALGKILSVTDGVDWTQCEDGQHMEILPGNLIWCESGRLHWYGAIDTTAMQHFAVTRIARRQTDRLDGACIQ